MPCSLRRTSTKNANLGWGWEYMSQANVRTPGWAWAGELRKDGHSILNMSGLTAALQRRVNLVSIVAVFDRWLVRIGMFKPGTGPLVKLQSLLAVVAIGTAALFFLLAVATKWQDGGGSDNVGVDVLWWVLRILYTLARIFLLGILLATIYQWLRSRRGSSASS